MMESPYADPTMSPEDVVVELASRTAVDQVFVGGQLLVDNGLPIGFDLPSLEDRVRASIARALDAIDDSEFTALQDHVADYYRRIDLAGQGFNLTGYGLPGSDKVAQDSTEGNV
jgi:hypothetical protein